MARAIERGPAEAAHRGGRRPHPGAHRHRPAGAWSGSTATARRRRRHPDAEGRQFRGAAAPDRQAGAAEGRTRSGRGGGRALEALDAGARGKANLLALSVEAARAKATVGEISLAMEKVFGRHRGPAARACAASTLREAGSEPAIAPRQGHGRGLHRGRRARRRRSWWPSWARTATTAARRWSPPPSPTSASRSRSGQLFQTPAEAAREAVAPGCTWSAPDRLAAGHLTLVPELMAELEKLGRADIMVVVGGVIPPRDVPGPARGRRPAIFPPGTVVADAASGDAGGAE